MSKATNKFELMSTKDICGQLCISSRTLERYRKRAPNENPFLSQIALTWVDPINGSEPKSPPAD